MTWSLGTFLDMLGNRDPRDKDSNEYDEPDFEGFHVTGLWALTGERRGYDRVNGLFKKIVPHSDVRRVGPGAWEPAARYSELAPIWLPQGHEGPRNRKGHLSVTSYAPDIAGVFR